MKNDKPIFIFLLMLFMACSTNPKENLSDTVKVCINYGSTRQQREIEIPFYEEITALEALQYAAWVETHPVGKYVFVSAIDSVKTVPGNKAWYYKVNGESPGKLAINNVLSCGDTLLWIYKTDVCSPKQE